MAPFRRVPLTAALTSWPALRTTMRTALRYSPVTQSFRSLTHHNIVTVVVAHCRMALSLLHFNSPAPFERAPHWTMRAYKCTLVLQDENVYDLRGYQTRFNENALALFLFCVRANRSGRFFGEKLEITSVFKRAQCLLGMNALRIHATSESEREGASESEPLNSNL